MRSSKKRSRSNQNRPRTLGNIVNRVFDSSGPEGKVRGTPQQIIEKYQMLARDAQLSNDRVAAENFLQHAEHYTRMLAEAMREMAVEQEARQQQYQQSGGQNGGHNGHQNAQPNGGQPRAERQGDGRERFDRGDRGDRTERQGAERQDRQDNRDRGERRHDFGRDFREERSFVAEEPPMASDVIELNEGDDTGLIVTPESVARSRVEPETVAHEVAAETHAKEERPAAARRPRGPRKPKVEAKPDGEPPQEAAE
jgi:Domain of unknown function (DUF4167)